MIMKLSKAIFVIIVSFWLIIIGLSAIYIVNSYLKIDINKIYSAIDKADELTITAFKKGKNEIIFTTKNPKDIKSFKTTLKLEKKIEWQLLACRGKLRVTLYKNKKIVSKIVYLPEKRIREEVTFYNLRIKELKSFQKWLKKRNINLETYLSCSNLK